MTEATREVTDYSRVGRKGTPRHYSAYGRELPTKVVPVIDGEADPNHPGLTLAEYAAAKRWEKEVGGVEVNGMTVATDDRSKMLISGARQGAENNDHFKVRFKFADGSFAEIDAPAIITISDAVLAHVQHCFAIEDRVQQAISDGTITSTSQIDTEFTFNLKQT